MAEFDLSYYKNEDIYSDGDIENDILDIVKSKKDVFGQSDERIPYPVIYHLSKFRENILNWYPFENGCKILEIGSGCGAITGILCDRARSVVSVELSKRRAEINYERNKDRDNLKILVGNLNDMSLDKDFDYIILNGVFEYACSFTEGKTPFVSFLNNIAGFLDEDGKIIIAIENRLGLKYFSGSVEDHTDIHFLGLNNYEGVKSVRTFSKNEIIDVLRNAGFNYTNFYYPYPDYKFPKEIFTDDTINSMEYGRPYNCFEQSQIKLFNREDMFKTMRKEGIVDRFANSFLIEASCKKQSYDNSIIYVKTCSDRAPQYRINTIIYKNAGGLIVRKAGLDDKAVSHIENIKKNESYESKGYLNLGIINSGDDFVEFEYISEKNLYELVCCYAEQENGDEIWNVLDCYYNTFFCDAVIKDYRTDEFISIFGNADSNKDYKCINPANIDLILDNIYINNEKFTVIDYEWVFNIYIPIKFIIWRMINELYNQNSSIGNIIQEKDMLAHFDINEDDAAVFLSWTLNFIYSYVGGEQLRLSYEPEIDFPLQKLIEKYSSKKIISAKLYMNSGKGYSEDETILVERRIKDDNSFSLTYNINGKLDSFRWDPSDCPCICKDIDIYIDGNKVQYINNAALCSGEDIFLDDDPWYDVRDISDNVESINITGKIYYLEDEQVIKDLNSIVEIEKKEIADLEKQNFDNKTVIDEYKNKLTYLSEDNEKLKEDKNGLLDNINVLTHNMDIQTDRINEQNKEIKAFHEYEGYVEQSIIWKYTKWHRRKTWEQFLQRYKVPFNIDLFSYNYNSLIVKGWILLSNLDYDIIYKTGKYERVLHTIKGISRKDVAISFDRKDYCFGFWSEWCVSNLKRGTVVIRYRNSGYVIEEAIGECGISKKEEINTYINDINKNGIKKYIPSLNIKKVISNLQSIRRSIDINSNSIGAVIPDIRLIHERYDLCESMIIPDDLIVDIVIPVYNGFEFLDDLFTSLYKTNVNMRVIIINDNSPDERVGVFLQGITQKYSNVILVNNEQNLGFVKSVNKAIKLCENHVVLINTDVVLPVNWLERLIYPIIIDNNVASVTPFTTCGTICSFPNFCRDNKLFSNLTVDQIDAVFATFKPVTYDIPTGVGFCMAMNKNAIKQIGLLDEENFGKGYGEENDWCQRAIENGFRNVHLCNLFVFHNHGGSFASDEKIRLINEHADILLKKHPNYNVDVANYVGRNPAGEIRNYALYKLIMHLYVPKVLYINHALGGGANDYLNKKRQARISNGEVVATLIYEYSMSVYRIQVNYQEFEVSYLLVNEELLRRELSLYSFDEVIINELVSYPDLFEMMNWIKDYCKIHDSRLIMLMHDYYSVCPGINLLDDSGAYCDVSHCQACVVMEEFLNSINKNGRDWENNWKSFLSECDEVTVFSHDTERILEKRYGILKNIKYVPHIVDYMPKLDKKTKLTDTINIGILGAMSKHKGYDIVNGLVELFDREEVKVKVIHFGNSDEGCQINSKRYVEYGRYRVGQLPNLIFKYDIDVFFIPSIWPETFSYTTQEIIEMNMPIAVLPIGAPAERVKKYEKGIVLSSWDIKSIAKELLAFTNKYKINKVTNKKVLFIREYQSFSSRYRVEHLAEQLLFAGIDYDYYDLSEVDIDDVLQYDALIVYRCRISSKMKSLVEKFKNAGKKTFYDTDDLIFNFDAIKNQVFLKSDEYKNFDIYSENMYECMSLFNNFITSTEHLKKEIINSFPNSNVIVNRNIASCEMLIESLKACEMPKQSNKIILGYFSGSRTHDNDFLLIEDCILNIMQKYDNIYLKVVGCLQLSKKFSLLSERIIYHDFVEWQQLPALIQSVSINLMPLVNDRFTVCKSENKWMEAALVKVPTIGSYNEELSLCINDGIDGMLCKDEQEWLVKLSSLIEDEKIRNDIAENAYMKCISCKTTLSKANLNINFLRI